MRNQTTKSHNAKSKIFITLLCIFGLLFSYSCQCKNNVSDPNNIPPDSGLPGSGTNTNNTITVNDGDLTTNSTRLIRVSGDTVKFPQRLNSKTLRQH